MKKYIINLIGATLAVLFLFSLVWPSTILAAGPMAVNLLSANNFTILAETGITNTGGHTISIIGNIGSSPITAAAMNTVFCSEMNGTIYGVDAAYVGSGIQTCYAGNPPLANKTFVDNGVLDMEAAYLDATSRIAPDGIELYAGNIGGQIFTPGLYKWSTDVSIPTSVTLSGGANDVWIFQIAGDLNVASSGSLPTGVKVILFGGAQAANVFWQVGGVTGATLGTYATFNGNILTAKQIIIQTGVNFSGRALAQTQVTLDANLILFPTILSTSSGSHQGTITVIKNVINDNGGTKKVADFPLFISGTPVISGETNGFRAPADGYLVSEASSSNYSRTFSGDCDFEGQVNLATGDNKVCYITNNDIAPVVVAPIVQAAPLPTLAVSPVAPVITTYSMPPTTVVNYPTILTTTVVNSFVNDPDPIVPNLGFEPIDLMLLGLGFESHNLALLDSGVTWEVDSDVSSDENVSLDLAILVGIFSLALVGLIVIFKRHLA